MTRSVLLLLAAALGVALPVAAQPELATAVVERRDLPREDLFDGLVEAVHHSTVSSQVSEQIVELPFDVDDYVPQGGIIVRFRASQQRARLDQAEAALREGQARMREAQDEYQRIKDVFAKKLVAKAEMDKATAARKAAAARLEAAQARVAEAREQLDRTVVRAPFSGIVTKRHVEVGETPGIGQPLLTGLSLERLRISVRVPQSLVARSREQCCEARILPWNDAAEALAPEQVTVFPIADTASHTFTVRLTLPQGQHGLYPGMLVKVAIKSGEGPRLLVPPQAVVHRSEVTGVYVVSSDGSLSFRYVRLGDPLGDEMEVLAGLQSGERVALDPVAAGIRLKTQRAGEN